MTQVDPFIQAIEENLTDLEDHIRSNRGHTEQALYTEALPRILNLFRGFLDAIENEPIDEEPSQGALLPIRYQTATAIEKVLVDVVTKHPENEEATATLLFLFEDLHGVSADDAMLSIAEAQLEEEKKEAPAKEEKQEG